MPLDVQPLSPARRALMVVVMLALLAASLGFAQLLIARHPTAPAVRVTFPSPPGVSRLPVNDSAEQVLVRGRFNIAQANWPGGPRQFVACCFPAQPGVNPGSYLSTLFHRLADIDPQQPLRFANASLGGFRAQQVAAESQTEGIPTFTIMRLADIAGYVVAFCFSGDGDFTDDDWRFFDAYCAHQIHIQVALPPGERG
jgi:hypothetical protein